MMAGHSFDKVASDMGDTPKVIQRYYGHFHPDYLRDAARSLEG